MISHGAAKRGHTYPEYSVWVQMIQRCHNPKNHSYEKYGALGIAVCQRWRASYKNFILDMGRRPSPLYMLDRINNLKG